MSHFLFADDSLFFYKAKPRECEEVIKVVRKYVKHHANVLTLINRPYSLVSELMQQVDKRLKMYWEFKTKVEWVLT